MSSYDCESGTIYTELVKIPRKKIIFFKWLSYLLGLIIISYIGYLGLTTTPFSQLQIQQRDLIYRYQPSPWSYTQTDQWKVTPEIRAQSPILCGNWMKSYQDFHASVSSGRYFVDEYVKTGKLPDPPILIFRIDPTQQTGGISDRWPILSTAMIIALLTNRAIYFDWPHYELAYTHPNLPYMTNTSTHQIYHVWSYYSENLDLLEEYRNQQPSHIRPYPLPPVFNDNLTWFSDEKNNWLRKEQVMYSKTHEISLLFEGLIPDIKVSDITSVGHLKQLFSRPFIHLTAALGGKGLTQHFFANPALSSQLQNFGLQEELCHGCMINFVLGLSDPVKKMFDPLAKILLAPNTLTIGLQFRMGDKSMQIKDNIIAYELTKSWFQCAHQLVTLHRKLHQHIVYYIVSEDLTLRKYLSQTYGNNPHFTILMSPIEEDSVFQIGHTDIGDKNIYNSQSILNSNNINHYLQTAAGEQWILAYCDYLIIDHYASGFGRSASLRSLNVKTSFEGRHAQDQTCLSESKALTLSDWREIGHKY